jgi:hypothetical protein
MLKEQMIAGSFWSATEIFFKKLQEAQKCSHSSAKTWFIAIIYFPHL